MIDNKKAILLIKKLAEQGFILEEGITTEYRRIKLTDNDLSYLNEHHSQGKYYKDRNNEILEAMVAGFYVSASKGEMFVPEGEIVGELGKTIKQNYPEASISFLRFARTYWSLRVFVNKLDRDDGYISFIGGRLLGVLEGEIGPVFFPYPGPTRIPPDPREEKQRSLLAIFAPNIDIEDFIGGNPILIRDRQEMKSIWVKSKYIICLKFLLIISTITLIVVLLSIFINIYFAIGIGVTAILFAWFKFNQHSASVGLFKANLFAYKKALESGMSEDAAVDHMVATRFRAYPTSLASEKAMEELETILFGLTEFKDRFSEPGSLVKAVVCAIFCYENRIPFASITTSLQNKYIAQIENEYNTLFVK